MHVIDFHKHVHIIQGILCLLTKFSSIIKCNIIKYNIAQENIIKYSTVIVCCSAYNIILTYIRACHIKFGML